MHTSGAVVATLVGVTPMFLGGAQAGQGAGFRVASLRGALRFWWRALAWGDAVASAGATGPGVPERAALAVLRRREVLLFGDTEGQGRLALALLPRSPLKTLKAGTVMPESLHPAGLGPVRPVGEGARYLGYGVMEAFDSANKGTSAGQLVRDCILPGQGVRVHIRIRPLAPPSPPPPPPPLPDARAGEAARGKAEERHKADCADLAAAAETFWKALLLFGLLGSLGSRARRGWGSVALHALEPDPALPCPIRDWQRPATLDSYVAAVRALLAGTASGGAEPPFTAFGAASRVAVPVPDARDPLEVLDILGRAMQRYRSWGHRGMVHGRPSERNFARDHDWSKDPFGPAFVTHVPERAVFGLPHNYGKEVGVRPAAPKKDRRASPLLLHVHPLASDWYIGVALVLPARFLPPGADGVLATQKDTKPRRYTPDWSILTRLLEGGPRDPARLKQDGPYFPARIPVLPQ